MENLAFLAPLLFISGVAVIVLVAVAIVQDMKQDRKYGYRQAFYTIVALVMLVMAAGSAESLLVTASKEIMPKAKTYSQRYNMPPSIYLQQGAITPDSKTATVPVAYTCTTDCQFTAVDHTAFNNWKNEYTAWRDNNNVSLQTRSSIAGSLSLLIISLPLYLFFARWMNRGAKEEYAAHPKTSPLRSVYFYGVSFAGLITAVVGTAFFLNTLISKALKTTPTNNTAMPVQVSLAGGDTIGADSVIACGAKCNISAEDVKLAQDWKGDWQTYLDRQKSNTGSMQNDLANTIPLILIGLPLFWYHFYRIRKETQAVTATPPTSTTV